MTHAPQVFSEAQVRAAIDMPAALESARQAFALTATGGVSAPAPWHLEMPDGTGEVHVKGAAVSGEPTFAIKMSTGFPRNGAFGQPTSSGFSTVFDATTGALRAVLLDNGYLTELRTGAAGALAADLLTHQDLDVATIIGAGGQSRFQIEGLLAVRQPTHLRLCARRPEQVHELAQWVRARWNITVYETTSTEQALDGAGLVVTVTGSRAPLFHESALDSRAHVTAIGSDSPGKRELPIGLLRTAALVAVDSIEQSQRLGELQGIDPVSLPHLTTIGELHSRQPHRPSGRTVADLSGLGVQDATVAAQALRALDLAG